MSFLTRKALSNTIKSRAGALGFHACGIAGAKYLEEDTARLKSWLERKWHGEMNYMENHFEKRTNPRLLFPGTRSVIVLLHNYYPEKPIEGKDSYKISKYAYGTDYHFIIKRKLKDLAGFITLHEKGSSARAFIDSAPILERAWARETGLGWIGKNTCLITKEQGSFFFIGVILTSVELDYDTGTVPNHCGGCTRCIDACPTQALGKDGIDARKCISYLTIEYRGDQLPPLYGDKMEDWIFGCDICQDVCPWNRLSEPHHQPEFDPPEKLRGMTRDDWHNLGEEAFNQMFKQSPLKRAKFTGIRRNMKQPRPGSEPL